MDEEHEEVNAPAVYEVTLHYRDQQTVRVYLSTEDAVLHLTDRLFTQKQLSIVIDSEKTLFLTSDGLLYASVTPPLE